MEFLKHDHPEERAKCRRHHIIHCILHATLQVATLAVAVVALCEIEKLRESVGHLKRAK